MVAFLRRRWSAAMSSYSGVMLSLGRKRDYYRPFHVTVPVSNQLEGPFDSW